MMKQTFVFAIIAMIMLVFCIGCVDESSQFSQKQKAYDAQYEAKKTPTPTPTPVPTIAYQDKELAQIIKENGRKYQMASTEITGAILDGDLDLADSGMRGLKIEMAHDEQDVKKMNIKNTEMKEAWSEYLHFNGLYVYRMMGAVKNIRKERDSNAKADMITATDYREEANSYYDIAIQEATKELN